MYRAKSDHKITYFLFCAKIEAVGRDQEIPENPERRRMLVMQASRQEKLLKILRDYPIIPSLQCKEDLPTLLASRARVVLISSGSIFNIEAHAQELKKNNKIVLVHIDLING